MEASISSQQYELLESLLWDGQSLFLEEAHITRLNQAASFFCFPFDKIKIEAKLHQHCSMLPASPHKIRLLVDKSGKITCQSLRISPVNLPVTCRLAESPVDIKNPFLYYKTTERTIYDQAMSAVLANHDDFEEVLLWNQRGELTESTKSNIIVEREGERFTPPLACGLLAGTFRQYLLQEGKVKESIISLDELSTIRQLWLVNSVRKWQTAELLPILERGHILQ